MTQRGGPRPGSGRPKGAIGKKTEKQIKAVEQGGLTPLEYMLEVMRDENEERPIRLDAAHKAAPYVHAKLSAVDHSSTDGTMSPVTGLDINVVNAPQRKPD